MSNHKIIHPTEQPPRSETPTAVNSTRSAYNQENMQRLANTRQSEPKEGMKTTYSECFNSSHSGSGRIAGVPSRDQLGDKPLNPKSSVVVIDAHRSHNAIFNFGPSYTSAAATPATRKATQTSRQISSTAESHCSTPRENPPKLQRSQSVESLRLITPQTSERPQSLRIEDSRPLSARYVQSQQVSTWHFGYDGPTPYRPTKRIVQPPTLTKDPRIIWDHYRSAEFVPTIRMVPRRGSSLNNVLEVKSASQQTRRFTGWNESHNILQPQTFEQAPTRPGIRTNPEQHITSQSQNEWDIGSRTNLGSDHGNLIVHPPVESDPFSRRLLLSPQDHEIAGILQYRHGGKLADQTCRLIYQTREQEQKNYTARIYDSVRQTAKERGESQLQRRHSFRL